MKAKGRREPITTRLSEPDTIFWNILDQVLIRPDLLDRFKNSDLRILTTDGTVSFLKGRGVPNESVASDHLPILFRLYL